MTTLGVLLLGAASLNDDKDSDPSNIDTANQTSNLVEVPGFLKDAFTNTDYSKSSVEYAEILQGQVRDGIPAINNPKFNEPDSSPVDDNVQALVYVGANEARAYPYNILNWHEIVNDEIDGVPVAVTFCPLCGSAVVFNRNTSVGVAEFGVSGALRESNMVMYDSLTESLWQQSTGQAIVGELNTERLALEPFQLMTIAEAKERFQALKILSQDTGFSRDYDRNPYSGYEDDNDLFYFAPSIRDSRYPDKEIFIVYNADGYSIATPNSSLIDGREYQFEREGTSLNLRKTDGEIFITDDNGERVPHYFEMWFSWSVQHQDNTDVMAEVFDPAKDV